MGTVRKALGLLDILAHPDARYGLTEMAQRSGLTKPPRVGFAGADGGWLC